MVNVGNLEILQIAESVAREKSIPRDIVIGAMEQAIQVAAKKKYGHELNIRVDINKKNGEIKIYRILDVVEVLEDYDTQIALGDAIEYNPDVKLGEQIVNELPPIDLGRVAAQAAKHVITQKVKEAERDKQYNDFKDRVGSIIGGVVKRIEFGNVFVDLGRVEAIIKRDQLIHNDMFKVNDRVRAYVMNVERNNRGPQILLSRVHNKFLEKLLELEVPEVYDNQIDIRAVARDPGSKAKIAVFASDTSIDAVGSCIGPRGNRIKLVSNELNGEKIDVILWNKDIAQYIVSAMPSIEITKIVIHQDRNTAEIIVPADHLSMAIGRRGQNIKLASELVGWKIEVMTEEQESRRRVDEFNNVTKIFVEVLDVDEVLAQLLAAEGFMSVEQLAATDVAVLLRIDGFDEELINELKMRATAYVDAKNEKLLMRLEVLGVEQELLDILNISLDDILLLAESGIKTIEDLAELSVVEFRAILPSLAVSASDVQVLLDTAVSISSNRSQG